MGKMPEGLASQGHSLSGVYGVSTRTGFLIDASFLRPQQPMALTATLSPRKTRNTRRSKGGGELESRRGRTRAVCER